MSELGHVAKAGRCEVKTCVAHMKIRSFPAVFVGYGAVLQQATLIARRDSFIADVALACGTTALAHCVNPGRMEAFVEDGARIWLEPAPEGSKRRCPIHLGADRDARNRCHTGAGLDQHGEPKQARAGIA